MEDTATQLYISTKYVAMDTLHNLFLKKNLSFVLTYY